MRSKHSKREWTIWRKAKNQMDGSEETDRMKDMGARIFYRGGQGGRGAGAQRGQWTAARRIEGPGAEGPRTEGAEGPGAEGPRTKRTERPRAEGDDAPGRDGGQADGGPPPLLEPGLRRPN